ncbi:MAG: hypothetical protein QM718_05805 [Steroidobacteraceae bacterium]
MFSIVESVHVLAITLVAGTVAIVDLRILGALLKGEGLLELAPGILRTTWLGFVVMLASGIALFWAEALPLYGNPAFRVKLLLLLLLGINQLWFHCTSFRTVAHWGTQRPAPQSARLAAVLSLLGWAGVIVCGRAIAYL